MGVKLNLIAAVCESMGIGKNNDLPWRIRAEMDYFTRMTSTTNNPNKQNVVIMGRRTWDSIPPKFKPLSNRINFILSRNNVDLSAYNNCFAFKSLDAALEKLKDSNFNELYEKVWVIGGSNIYKESMDSPNFYRLYMTYIKKDYDCDTFFPELKPDLKEVIDPDVPQEIQSEKGVDFVYKVYENPQYTF